MMDTAYIYRSWRGYILIDMMLKKRQAVPNSAKVAGFAVRNTHLLSSI
jgi:hypothetical protein